MKKTRYIIILASMVLIAGSCIRRPADYATNRVRIHLQNNYMMPYSELAIKPYHYDILFYDKGTRALISDDFCEEKGGPTTAAPGRYSVFAIDLDNSTTKISGRDSIHTLRAYSDRVLPEISTMFKSCQTAFLTKTKADGLEPLPYYGYAGYESDNIINEPDPLFTGINADITVPHLAMSDDEFIVPIGTSSALDQGRITIHGIKNTDFISSVQLFITNLASSRNIYTGTPDDVPSTIQILPREISEEKIEGVFNHFGIIRGSDIHNTVYIVVTTLVKEKYLFVNDVTEQMQSAGSNADLELYVSLAVPMITPEAQGGLTPVTKDWAMIQQNVVLGKTN